MFELVTEKSKRGRQTLAESALKLYKIQLVKKLIFLGQFNLFFVCFGSKFRLFSRKMKFDRFYRQFFFGGVLTFFSLLLVIFGLLKDISLVKL